MEVHLAGNTGRLCSTTKAAPRGARGHDSALSAAHPLGGQTYEPHQPTAGAQGHRRTGLTGAQQFWYVLQCIAFGAGYFAKIPAKKALADFGMAELTSAERFWYVLQCIAFGAGYFAKLPTAKALSEMPQFRSAGY